MAIYLGENKLTGTGVQVDDALSSNSTNPVENKAVTEALTDVGYNDWQKPSEWIDIRSGAQPNSVYFLVAHSADYTTYPSLVVNPTISNSGTYDVYIDGIKQASAVASATETTLSWQTLALTSGWDVTYPAQLRTHIVRVTPTSSSDTMTRIRTGSISNKGILWAHFTTANYISLANFAQSNTSANASTQAPVWEVVTSLNDELKVSSLNYAFNCTPSITYIPTFIAESNANTTTLDYCFAKTKVKKLKLVNVKEDGYASFRNMYSVQEIKLENCIIGGNPQYIFDNARALKYAPSIDLSSGSSWVDAFNNMENLGPTVLDFSSNTGMNKLVARGSSSYPSRGIKGVTVSNAAPFGGSSPQINVSYTGLDRAALVNLFNSMPTVTDSQVCNITSATGAADLTAEDLAIATGKGWSISR